MISIDALTVKIFADAADLDGMIRASRDRHIKGFTTNPTLMRRAGVTDYARFAREAVDAIPDRPISFEVFSDEIDEMERQAHLIAGWGEHVYVKIPVTNTRGEPTAPLSRRLSRSGIKLNVTALLTLPQVRQTAEALAGGAAAFISVFAGRVADTGVDPVPLMAEALAMLSPMPGIELIWASPREVLNVVQADAIGCHIITVTPDVLGKLALLGRELNEYSLDTVRMFHRDAAQAGYRL